MTTPKAEGIAPSERLRRLGRLALPGVIVGYLLVLGSFLWAHDFAPYVFDNNESYSAYFHAKNLYEHGLGETYGLPDEVWSPDPAAHPFVYTHGGNFPRLPLFALHALGFRSVPVQIAIMTFTVGLAGVILAFLLFRRLVSPGFAALACGLLVTDYVMFVQWQANTWRVWHAFFFFSSFLCMLEACRSSRAGVLLLAAVNFFCLFYYELMFAVFVSTAAALFAGWSYREKPRAVVGAWVVSGIGAALAVGCVVLQISLYLGWEGFLEDLVLTFNARNQAATPEAFFERARAFSIEYQTAIWFNFMDGAELRTLRGFVRAAFHLLLQVYTPALSLVMLSLCGGFAADRLASALEGGRMRLPRGTQRWLGGAFAPGPTRLALTTAPMLFAGCVLVDADFAQVPTRLGYGGISGYLVGVALGFTGLLVCVALALRWAASVGSARELPSRCRVVLCSLLFVLLALLTRAQQWLYDGALHPVQYLVASRLGPMILPQLAVVLSGGVVLAWLVGGRALERARRPLRDTALPAFLVSAGAAFVLVYLLSPGALHSGYLYRQVPFTVFVHCTTYALASYICIAVAVALWRALRLDPWVVLRLRATVSDARVRAPWRPACVRAACAALATCVPGFLLVYWLSLQRTYAELLPADSYAFLEELAQEPYRGVSFVTNTYAAPMAAQTGGWAYHDPRFGQAEMRLLDSGYELVRDDRYLWFADREHNAAYAEPDYYLCVMTQYLHTASSRLGLPGTYAATGCSSLPIVRAAERGESVGVLDPTLVARDPSGFDRWALLSVRFSYPPYLERLDGDGTRVGIRATTRAGAPGIEVEYRFRQQQGEAEATTEVVLYEATRDPCSPRYATARGRVERRFAPLDPERSAGRVWRVGVRPSTRARVGERFWSEPFRFAPSGVEFVRCPRSPDPSGVEASRPMPPEVARVRAFEEGADG